MKFRNSKRNTSLRMRSTSINSEEKQLIQRFKREIKILLIILQICEDDDDDIVPLLAIIHNRIKNYHQLALIPYDFRLNPLKPRLNIGIDDIDDQTCEFKFKIGSQANLRRLYNSLHCPPIFILDNRQKVTGELSFIYSLRRLHFPCRHEDLITEFGGETTFWSRVFNTFIKYCLENFKHKIYNSIQIWNNHFPIFANSIKNKLLEDGLYFLNDIRVLICGFLDDTQIETCSPGLILKIISNLLI